MCDPDRVKGSLLWPICPSILLLSWSIMQLIVIDLFLNPSLVNSICEEMLLAHLYPWSPDCFSDRIVYYKSLYTVTFS